MPLGPFRDIDELIIGEIETSYFKGQSLTMSLVHDCTPELFRSFMPVRKTFQSIDQEAIVYDIRVYPKDYYTTFNPAKEYTKWAAVRISEDRFQDAGEDYISISAGLYAQFTIHSNMIPPNLYQYIFTTWITESSYQLDDRPHFDRLWPHPHQRGTVIKQVITIPII